MIKKTLIKTFKEKFLPLEIEARNMYDQMLSFSDDKEADEVITAIRDGETKHIELCEKAIKILENS
jgi:rubrerythrin